MRNGWPSALIGASLSMALSGPASGQAGPPAASSLEDISGCSVEGDVVFIVTGRDATTRRYKYAWDASIDALCNAKGFAIRAPVKTAQPAPAQPVPAQPVPARPAAPAVAPAPAGAGAANSAPAASTDFPADAQPLSADGITRKVSGRTFDTQLRDGTRVRLEYKSNGYLFANATGYANSGPWRAEDSRICSQMRGATASCNEVREQGQRLYLRRDNGEIIALDPR